MNVTRMLSAATVLGTGLLTMACPRSDRPARDRYRAAPPPQYEPAPAPPSQVAPQPQTEGAPQPQTGEAPRDVQRPAETLTAAGARRKIIQARCEYEQRCGRMGSGRQFASMTACTDKVAEQWRGALFQTCPEGVNAAQVNQCIAAFTSQDCGRAPAKPGDILECDLNKICASGTY